MKLVKPNKLNKGDTIGVVSPCLPLLPQFKEQYDAGIRELKKLGFLVKKGKTTGLKHWWSGGTPQQQAEDVNAMFKDTDVKAIIATSGGYSAISVLELLDYEAVVANPKPFIGMSDMTSYHLALYSNANLVGFHMDEVCFGMGMNWQNAKPATKKQSEEMFLRFLTKPTPAGVIPPLRERKTWRKGKAKGKLIGGNLSSLARQVGTPYFPPLEWFDGAILFWEAVGLHKYDIAQMLYQLKYHGMFDRIAGMLVGTITAVQAPRDEGIDEPTISELTLSILKQYNFPILAGLDFGHYTVNMPMPLGLKVAMDAGKQTLEFLESAVRD